jgi:hypothetical protein
VFNKKGQSENAIVENALWIIFILIALAVVGIIVFRAWNS